MRLALQQRNQFTERTKMMVVVRIYRLFKSFGVSVQTANEFIQFVAVDVGSRRLSWRAHSFSISTSERERARHNDLFFALFSPLVQWPFLHIESNGFAVGRCGRGGDGHCDCFA